MFVWSICHIKDARHSYYLFAGTIAATLSFNVVLLDLAIQCGATDSEQLGGLGHVVAGSIEGLGDEAFFPFIDTKFFELAAAGIAERQIVRANRIFVG